MIRQFKSAVTRQSRKNTFCKTYMPDFAWQTRFHDRIIRDVNELNRIRIYIRKNPEQ